MKHSLHGGNIHAAARALGVGTSKVLDLSASINPLGMPASVQAAICASLKSAEHYPDPDMVDLTSALAAYHEIDADAILCGNGSTELIYLIAQALRPQRALLCAPTFAEYERAIKASGKWEVGREGTVPEFRAERSEDVESGLSPAAMEESRKQKKAGENCGISYFHLKENDAFRLDTDAFITAMADMVSSQSKIKNRKSAISSPESAICNPQSALSVAFLCNPNNPTGALTPREDVLKIARAARKLKCYLVVDEAFIDFCPEHSVIDAAAGNPYLIVLRSMTKFYALAGIRLGYGVFPPAVMRRMREIREPWTVSTIAGIAGLAALEDDEYRTKTMKIVMQEKQFLEKSFRALGIDYLPSAANYYLLKMSDAVKTIDALADKGILLRSCANFRGLTSSHARVAVRSRRENTRFLKELTACRP